MVSHESYNLWLQFSPVGWSLKTKKWNQTNQKSFHAYFESFCEDQAKLIWKQRLIQIKETFLSEVCNMRLGLEIAHLSGLSSACYTSVSCWRSSSFCSSLIPPLHHSPLLSHFLIEGFCSRNSTTTCSERDTISSDCLLVCISFAVSLVFYIVVHPSSWNHLLIWPYHILPLSPPSQIGPFLFFAGFVHSLPPQISIIC